MELMSTKKGYVSTTNGICYLEFSQSLKIKYSMVVEQNVARSCELFVLLCRFLYGTTPVIRRYTCEVLGNLDRNEGNLAWKYFQLRPKLYSRKSEIRVEVQNVSMSCVYETRANRFTMLESLFTRLHNQKTAWRCIEIFKRWRIS